MSSQAQSQPNSPRGESHSPVARAFKWLALLAISFSLSACSAFQIDVGTEDAIKLDPIKIELAPIDVDMRVDVYQYTGKTEEQKQAIKNVASAVENQRNRMKQIQKLKDSRFIGENRLGLVSIRDLPAGDYGNYVQKTVDDENADRIFLMTDKSNKSGESLAAVRQQQWQTRIQDAFNGELIQVPGRVEGTYTWTEKKKLKK